MEIDGTRARTAQEARLKEPKDSPTKKRASNDVILQYDLTAGDENTGTTDDDELAHAAGTPVAKVPPPKGAHRRQSDSPDFGREVPGTKHPFSLAAPPSLCRRCVRCNNRATNRGPSGVQTWLKNK